jgi:hypothetical protein
MSIQPAARQYRVRWRNSERDQHFGGRPSLAPEVSQHVRRGIPARREERRFVATFRRGERCTAVLGVNRPRLVIQARMKLTESLDWAPVAELFG